MDSGGCHLHTFSQIVFPVLRGAVRFDVEGSAAVVSGNLMAVLPAGHTHRYEPSPGCKVPVMDVTDADLGEDRVPPLLRDKRFHVIAIEPWLWRLFRLLSAEIEGNARRSREAGLVALTGLQLIQPNVGHCATPGCHWRVARVAQAMAEQPNRRSVADWASAAALSQSQFHALFRAMVGQSPKQFQVSKLLDRAADRLVTTRDPVSVIAHELGYQDVSSFNRLFRRHFGTTPTGFR
ncbi:MAG: helix-turn-helix domain-containing protein, partial [Longimicrobiales bacterium]